MTLLQNEAQKLEPSAIVSLFTLDTSVVGGPVLHFVMSRKTNGANIVYGGITYVATDVKFEGLETTGVGGAPTPSIHLANSNEMIQAVVNAYGDLNGCTVRRARTFARFLDGEPDADPTAYFGPDIYKVEQKSSETHDEIIWQLSSAVDQEGKMIPGRTIIRDTCVARYRVWNPLTGTFDYLKAQCPYVGAQSYDINDLPVASALDVPSRRVSCCETRFGAGQPLPFWGFPGVSRSVT